MLNNEERIAVGSALSQNFFLSLNDYSYGTLFPRIIIHLAVRSPLEYLPITLFAVASLLWALYSLIIFWLIFRATNRYSIATLAGLLLILVPLPGLGMQGVVWNSFWPMFTALTVVVCCSAYETSKSATIGLSILAFFTAASNPVTAVLLVLIVFDYWRNEFSRKKILLLASSLFTGLLFSLYVQVRQEPQYRYLGDWTQELAQTSQTFGWIEEAGGSRVRGVPPFDFSNLIQGIPGSIKYFLTQMAPEPFASKWILTESVLSNLFHVFLLAAVFFVVPLGAVLFLRSRNPDSPVPQIVLRLSVIFVLVEALQIYLIGGVVQTRQLLFAPICCYWLAIFLLLPRTLKTKLKFQYAISIGAVSLLLVFGLLAKQNFRDPLDVKLPLVGNGRYEEKDLWRPALNIAREKCDTLSPDAIIIISQKTDIWVDAPVVVKCKFIAK
ncbi:MAG: hypothetical protein F2741_02030 [Actinobacteria bacterium]|nr:hypothetical protein [Actinomycetota bacterium]